MPGLNARANKPTRNDVAKRAGVSPAVVSYVLNNSNYVSAETYEKVVQAIRDLEYRPHHIARSLKTKRTKQLLLMANDIRNEFFVELAYFLETSAFSLDYSLFVANARDDRLSIRPLLDARYDGVYILSDRFSTEDLNEIAKSGVTVAFSPNRPYDNLSREIIEVDLQFYQGMQKLLEYLMQRNYRRFCMVAPVELQDAAGKNYRIQAFRDAARRYGFQQSILFLDPDDVPELTGAINRVISDRKKRPEVFVSINDMMAFRVVQVLRRLGRAIPEDVAVTGFDNIRLAGLMVPTLTTVDIPKREMSERIISALTGGTGRSLSESIEIETNVVVRESA